VLKVLLADANEGVREELRIEGHELVPVGILRDTINILVDELERLLAQHGVVVQLGDNVGLYDRVHAQVLDEILATLDLERLNEVLLGGDVEVAGDGSDVGVGRQVGRVDVLEHGSDDIGSTVLDDHAARQRLLEPVVEHGLEDGRACGEYALVSAELDERGGGSGGSFFARRLTQHSALGTTIACNSCSLSDI
jgi:hypothetical protein